MDIGANSTATEIPSMEDSEERNFIQCKEFNLDTAQLENSTAVKQLINGIEQL